MIRMFDVFNKLWIHYAVTLNDPELSFSNEGDMGRNAPVELLNS